MERTNRRADSTTATSPLGQLRLAGRETGAMTAWRCSAFMTLLIRSRTGIVLGVCQISYLAWAKIALTVEQRCSAPPLRAGRAALGTSERELAVMTMLARP